MSSISCVCLEITIDLSLIILTGVRVCLCLCVCVSLDASVYYNVENKHNLHFLCLICSSDLLITVAAR